MTHTADEIINAIARIMDPDIWAASDQPFSEPTLMFDREASKDRAKSVYAACLRMLREPRPAHTYASENADHYLSQERYWRSEIDARIRELS